ncbi:hypothetical protein Q5H91_09930 [Sphingomonas sp. KR1UV-12]|uniref:Tetratricopeptide repeat protein n=1 Tax=Sphingomonas aurea TaxID=3063994 RepID=A0ABT9EKR5_9SPHN|nr:hypothetical protein [Sphingomonas sp. KR1UV-12]MDP1027531.1 hypothetical protein [Sphingomonas sp. KR1UV-12]
MRRLAGVMAIVALVMAGSAPAETVRVDGVFAAGVREVSLLPTIGVDLFDGPDGDALGVAIERRLATLGEDGVPHARIVAASLRPDGLLSGRASSGVEDFNYIETRERCVEKKDDKCVRRAKYRVGCTRRTVTLHADLRLVRHSDGRVLYTVPKSRSDTDSWCEDGGVGISVDAALHSMTESIAQEVRLDLAPHRERYAIRIKEDRDGLPPDLADRFHDAVRLTKHDQSAACAAFAQIGEAAPDHGPTLFNRALCAEASGHYAEATDLYTRARVFAPKAGGDVSKGLGRVASLAAGEEDVRRLAAL